MLPKINFRFDLTLNDTIKVQKFGNDWDFLMDHFYQFNGLDTYRGSNQDVNCK